MIIILHCNHPPACFIRRRQCLSSWGPSSNTIHSAARACTDTLFLGGEPRQTLHISSIITQPCLVHSLATLRLLSFVICYILCSVGMNGSWTLKNVSRSEMLQESRSEAFTLRRHFTLKLPESFTPMNLSAVIIIKMCFWWFSIQSLAEGVPLFSFNQKLVFRAEYTCV